MVHHAEKSIKLIQINGRYQALSGLLSAKNVIGNIPIMEFNDIIFLMSEINGDIRITPNVRAIVKGGMMSELMISGDWV